MVFSLRATTSRVRPSIQGSRQRRNSRRNPRGSRAPDPPVPHAPSPRAHQLVAVTGTGRPDDEGLALADPVEHGSEPPGCRRRDAAYSAGLALPPVSWLSAPRRALRPRYRRTALLRPLPRHADWSPAVNVAGDWRSGTSIQLLIPEAIATTLHLNIPCTQPAGVGDGWAGRTA